MSDLSLPTDVCPAVPKDSRATGHFFATCCVRLATHWGLSPCQCADGCFRCKFCGLEWARAPRNQEYVQRPTEHLLKEEP